MKGEKRALSERFMKLLEPSAEEIDQCGLLRRTERKREIES